MKHSSAAHSQVPELDRAWDPLVLEVGLEWPLGLLLGREQLRRYNQLFALLLRLRRMQVRSSREAGLRIGGRGRGR